MELINRERRNAGLSRVDMGDNVAAQLHAESMLENCFTSHWGIDGLKPYMRYALEGGDQYSSENASGLDYCITAGDGYRGLVGIEEEVEDVMEGLMDSPGHRDNILAPLHRKVNIGLAWDRYNFFAVQLFEGDYVDYQQYPIIEGDILKISGSTKNGADLDYSGNTSSFSIYYDPPPHELTRGQVARTYCYGGGRPVAFLRKPLGSGFYYIDDEFTSTYSPCPDPYGVDPLAPPGSFSGGGARSLAGCLRRQPGVPGSLLYRAKDNDVEVEGIPSEVLGGGGPEPAAGRARAGSLHHHHVGNSGRPGRSYITAPHLPRDRPSLDL